MKAFLLSVLQVTVLWGCSSYLVQWHFDESLDAYNESLRWHEWDKASLYASDSTVKEFNARVAAAKDVKVVDYRILKTTYHAEKREATVDVEIDYYKVYAHMLKTVHDTQEWAYVNEHGTESWKLLSGFPEFK